MPPRVGRILKISIFLLILFGIFLTVEKLTGSLLTRSDAPSPRGSLESPIRSPTRYSGRVPIVDRQKLAEIESHFLYNVMMDGIPVWDPPDNPRSPPKITEVPQPTGQIVLNNHHRIVPNKFADGLLCPDVVPCRLLVPTWIAEQESKASQHLYQLALLSQQLNRTLVLPNMWKSRFGTCNRNPFEYYYDIGFFTRSKINTATFESFKEWAADRATPPVMCSFSIESEPAHEVPDMAQGVFLVTPNQSSVARRRNCLERLDRRGEISKPPIIVYPTRSRWHIDSISQSEYTQGLISTLSAYHDVDVIALSWEVKHPIFSSSVPIYLEYAPRWIDLARSLSKRLSPFIAVHWRMETLDPKGLPACAPRLIDLLSSIKQQSNNEGTSHRIQNVYLATDYPLEPNSRPHSGTFHYVTEDHHLAMRIFKGAFERGGSLQDLTLGSFAKHSDVLHAIGESVDGWDADLGLLGILDKSVAMNAEYFVSGGAGCGRASSFTAQIIQERAKKRKELGLKNVIDIFTHHARGK
ncbi:uncharacterized protein EI90DRAFT_3037868 [Cantharellus anzutake]|uniref:uncharacterized protein n=1 Tax=Cantharellus anzutake TaxID=1750568 RepID=UPI001904BB24|nr:uncharacterized protein EI90DRAFT_3037868 [Cantharellus anzutake]KAF8339818.1 hypothetical protein EI90DRAFT_3037868 [Cantharellus anzutake]